MYSKKYIGMQQKTTQLCNKTTQVCKNHEKMREKKTMKKSYRKFNDQPVLTMCV